jgi:RND superfamily putative drug exporter
VADAPERLVRALHRHRRPLLACWLAVLAAAALAALPLTGRLSGGGWYVPGSGSQQAAAALRHGFADRGASNLVLVVRDDRDAAGSAAFDRRVGAAMTAVAGDKSLHTVGGYGWQTVPPADRGRFTGRDGHTAVTTLGLALDDGTARRVLPGVQTRLDHAYAPQGLRVSLVSAATLWGEVNALSLTGLERAELLTFPLLLVILLLLYRGVVAAVVSFTVALTAIVLTLGVVSLLAAHGELAVFVENAATMIGLGVSVDYSLFVISRHTDELARGRGTAEALTVALRTSGRAVLFSGLIVIASMACLFLTDLVIIRSIALGILLVVAFAVLAALVVLPLVLLLLGERVLRGRLPGRRGAPEERERRWRDAVRRVMRRPVVSLLAAGAALLALAVPALGLRTFTPDARVLPSSSPVRTGYEALRTQFGPGAASPLEVVITAPVPLATTPAGARVLAMADRLVRLPQVTRLDSPLGVLRAADPAHPLAALSGPAFAALPPAARAVVDHHVSADRRTLVLDVTGDDYASSAASRRLLARIRAETDPLGGDGLRAVVGGETAEGVDANAAIADALPGEVALMLAVIFLLLLVTFRSLLLPLKAIAINLLSLGATYGVLVLVFQHPLGADLFGLPDVGYLQNFVPVLLLAILFSLSTDYEVFLLHRIREAHLAGADNATSVATGTARSAPLISGAALLMVAVFAAFAFTGILPIQQLGFGLAVAIALDATVVRLVVVPAAMRLMGRWNWWLPARTSPALPERTPVARG